jgi:hypothetical protein
MLRSSLLLAATLGVALSPVGVTADTLLLDSVQTASAVSRPASGVTKERVVQDFGEPQQRLGPVGDPPISHWVYPDFVVYFEHDRVIHAVVPHH